MIELFDYDGDYVKGHIEGGLYVLETDPDRDNGYDLPYARLSPTMARKLAVDLLAFADSADAGESER